MHNCLDNFSNIALFGSMARGDHDLLSDRDLLVVSESNIPVRQLEELRKNGFSPAAYTWSSLESLAKYQSLFLVHLKLESRIIKDHDLRLSDFLSRVNPSQDYSGIRRQSGALAALTSGVPKDANLLFWAADVLAVALRNYLVALAAESGVFIFSYGALIDYAYTIFNLDGEDRRLLQHLRTWKAAYRNKGIRTSESPSLEAIQAVQRTISSIIKRNVGGRAMEIQEFVAQLLHGHLPAEPWYHSIRRYEGAYRAIDARYFEENLIDVIEEQIATPSCYTGDGRVQWKLLRSSVVSGYLRSNN